MAPKARREARIRRVADGTGPVEAQAEVAELLRRLTEEGGSDNFVIVEVGDCRYVQFLSACGSATIHGETSSGRYCRSDCTCAPSAAAQTRLRSLGWRPPTRRKFLNFYRCWPVITPHDRQAIAGMAVATLSTLGWDGEPLNVRLHLDW